MEYYNIGDALSNADYNALVYLLRKFKKLTIDLKIGESIIESNYGTFNFSEGFTNIGNNWILEDNVTVTSNDVLKNTFYTFNFVVIDVNTTGTVNRRIVSVTGGTGENGELSLEIPVDLINADEVILPDYTVEVVFDEHEYYTPLPGVHLSLSVDKRIIEAGEVATITGLLTDSTSTPIENVSLLLNVDGTTVTVITDSMGEFNYAYTGTGTRGKVLVSAFGESVFFYDGIGGLLIATFTGENITMGNNILIGNIWMRTDGDVITDWDDGTTDTVNNPSQSLSHTYNDGETDHTIIFYGTVTSLGNKCFRGCSGLTSVTIPESVTSLGSECFRECSGLNSITIPESITSIGINCFRGCSSLTSITIPESVNSIESECFYGCSSLTSITIPESVTSIGTSCFRGCSSLTSITIPESVTSLGGWCFYKCSGLTSVTIPESVNSIGSNCFQECYGLINYELYWETLPITYDNIKMPVNANTVFTIPYGTMQNYIDAGYPANRLVERMLPADDLVLSCSTPIIQTGDSTEVTALLTGDGIGISGETLSYSVKHDDTIIDTGSVVTGSDGTAIILYTGTGVGDVTFEVSYGTLLQKTFVVQDCYFYDDATTDKTSNYGTAIGLRNTGTASLTYTTNYYSMSPSKNSCESFIPINSATGLDDITIEYDGYLDNDNTTANMSFLGLTTYLDSNNWQRLGTKILSMEYGGTTNGAYTETDITGTSAPRYTWLHFKFTITNDSIHREIYNGSTLLYEDTRTYTGLFTSSTKYGFPVLWNINWKARFKNLIVKAL